MSRRHDYTARSHSGVTAGFPASVLFHFPSRLPRYFRPRYPTFPPSRTFPHFPNFPTFTNFHTFPNFPTIPDFPIFLNFPTHVKLSNIFRLSSHSPAFPPFLNFLPYQHPTKLKIQLGNSAYFFATSIPSRYVR